MLLTTEKSSIRRAVLIAAAAVFYTWSSASVAQQAGPPPNRAEPPHWTPDDLDLFFRDARDQLVGERPEPGSLANGASGEAPAASTGGSGSNSAGSLAWSKLISPDVLEDEIKSINLSLASAVASPTEYSGGGYVECYKAFSQLTLLFKVVGQYDGRVRWKEDGGALSELFKASSLATIAGEGANYTEARRRKEDLDLLVRGERLQIDPPSQESTKKEILDLKPYMARMKVAFQERIKPSLASERTFAESIDQIGHEAQILALMAEEIGSPRYSYAEEELYQEYVGMLRTGARRCPNRPPGAISVRRPPPVRRSRRAAPPATTTFATDMVASGSSRRHSRWAPRRTTDGTGQPMVSSTRSR